MNNNSGISVKDFSSGYYQTELYVVPFDDGPTVQDSFYDWINRKMYAATDAEPRFRLGMDGDPYFTVDTEYTIPADHLGIPTQWFREDDIAVEPYKQYVYMLKPGYSYLLDEAKSLQEHFDESAIEEYENDE